MSAPGPIAAAAACAPSTPGVSLLLGARDALLSVGKAGNLRRRLQEHARTEASAGARRAAGIHRVRAVRYRPS